MGLVHATATLEPSKQELLEAWLPSQPWSGGATTVEKVGEYRIDDPDGEVGVETILWRTPDGSIFQVPFTYRGTPLAGAQEHLIGTTEHSVLGIRYVYDGCGDPLWAAVTAAAILTGGSQSQMVIERDGQTVDVPPRVVVRGSGSPEASAPEIASVESIAQDGPVTAVTASGVTLSLARVVGTPLPPGETLTGSTADQDLGVLVSIRS
jgi:hypothetical protein